MLVYEILIPTLRNSNHYPHEGHVWADFEACLLDNFGGFTKCVEVTGAWLDHHGNVVPDHSIPYRVAVNGEQEAVALRCLVQRSKGVFDQQCIYFGKVGTAELV